MFQPVSRAIFSPTWRLIASRQQHPAASICTRPHREQHLRKNNLLSSQSLVQTRSFSLACSVRAAETIVSETAVKADELVVDFVIPDRPVPLADQAQQALDVGGSLAEPTFQSLGLASNYPSGWAQYLMENIHIVGDIPWWGTIMITTLGIRLVVFPLVVYGQKNAVRVNNHTPGMKKLTTAMTEARERGDVYESQRIGMELQAYNKKYDINPLNMLKPLLLQIPIFMSMFFGLRGMSGLPVESMETGGLFWFTDLTVPDPYMILPLATAGSMFLQIKFAADGMNVQNLGPLGKGAMKVMPLFMVPITMNFPAALTYYWALTNLISVSQARMLRIEAVRKTLGIQKHIKWDTAKITGKKEKGFVEACRETMDNYKVQSDMADRRAFDEQQFREAGLTKPKRTYKFDPTKPIGNTKRKRM